MSEFSAPSISLLIRWQHFRWPSNGSARIQEPLLVLHVIEAQPTVLADALVMINKKANDVMAQLIASARHAVETSISSEVTSGRAYVEIVDRAREWKADLVLLGARGVTSLEGVIVGGTAESVVREAPCSVLVARPG